MISICWRNNGFHYCFGNTQIQRKAELKCTQKIRHVCTGSIKGYFCNVLMIIKQTDRKASQFNKISLKYFLKKIYNMNNDYISMITYHAKIKTDTERAEFLINLPK
jgi:hypothetical protein